MLLVYGATIVFQLKTHTHLFDEEEDENDESILGFWGAMFWMLVITVLLAFLSEFLVASIEQAAIDYNVSTVFIATIVIPIVGNAAEHAAAVIMAYRNKMEIAMGVAVGSATQIALFVIPACVVWAWAIGKELDVRYTLTTGGNDRLKAPCSRASQGQRFSKNALFTRPLVPSFSRSLVICPLPTFTLPLLCSHAPPFASPRFASLRFASLRFASLPSYSALRPAPPSLSPNPSPPVELLHLRHRRPNGFRPRRNHDHPAR